MQTVLLVSFGVKLATSAASFRATHSLVTRKKERLRSHSRHTDDAGRALVNLYEDLGLEALKKLNGWFSGLLVDLGRHQVVLFNDRYGLNRIYVHEQNGRLFFRRKPNRCWRWSLLYAR